MDLHVKILAAFHIVFGLLGLVAALGILIVFGGMAGAAGFAAANEPDAWLAVPILSIIGSVLRRLGSAQGQELGPNLDDRPLRAQPHQCPNRDTPRHLRIVGVTLERDRVALQGAVTELVRAAVTATSSRSRLATHGSAGL